MVGASSRLAEVCVMMCNLPLLFSLLALLGPLLVAATAAGVREAGMKGVPAGEMNADSSKVPSVARVGVFSASVVFSSSRVAAAFSLTR